MKTVKLNINPNHPNENRDVEFSYIPVAFLRNTENPGRKFRPQDKEFLYSAK